MLAVAAPRLVVFRRPETTAPRLLLIKGGAGSGKPIANMPGYFFHSGRWHKTDTDKPAPKGAPQAHHPEAAGLHTPVKHFSDEQWAQLKLPAENSNAPSHNAKIDQIKELSEGGHVTGLLGLGLGTNTYSKKQAAVVNNLLGLHGSPHLVTAGQKAGSHPAVLHPVAHKDAALQEAIDHLKEDAKQGDLPASEHAEDAALVQKLEAAKNADPFDKTVGPSIADLQASGHLAPGPLVMPDFEEGKTVSGVKAHYSKVAQQIIDHGHAGNASVLDDMKAAGSKPGASGKVANTWAGKTSNSKKLLALHAQAMDYATGKTKPSAEPAAPSFKVNQGNLGNEGPPQHIIGDNFSGIEKLLGLESGDLADTDSITYTVTNEKGQTLSVYKQVGALSIRASGSNNDAASVKALAAHLQQHVAKEGDTKPAINGGTLVLKDGHWVKHGGDAPASATSDLSADQLGKLQSIPWFKLKLPVSNTNAKSHNAAVSKIEAMAFAGDTAGLQAFVDSKKDAKQTYAKKQGLLAQTALAALQEDAPAAPSMLQTNNAFGNAKPVRTKTTTQEPSKVSATLLHHTTDGHNKFWAASLSPDGLSLMTTYGKIGSNGQKTVKKFATQAQSADAINDLIDEKKNKGYKYVGQTVHEHDVASAADTGPKDGDTKPGTDGVVLVFKDGRWHKQVGDSSWSFDPSDAALSGNPSLKFDLDDSSAMYVSYSDGEFEAGHLFVDPKKAPEFEHFNDAADALSYLDSITGGNVKLPSAAELSKLIGKSAEPTKPAVKKLTPKEAISIGVGFKTSPGNKAKLKAMAVAGDIDGLNAFISDVKSKPWPATKALAEKIHTAMTAGASGTPTAYQPAPAAKQAPAVGGIQSMDDWIQTGGQGGSNPGGKFKDPSSQEWYCKFPADDDTAKSEVLAAKLYAVTGLASQDAMLVTKGGKTGIASKWVDVKKADTPAKLAAVAGAQEGFAVDAWLANWDVIGLGYDNLQIGADGKAVRIDAGGSLEYRAKGAKKPFGASVDEIDTLRDKSANPQSSAVFGKMTKADITASVAKVAAISDVTIRALVNQYGPGDQAAKSKLAETLIARKEDLLKRYPAAAKVKKKIVFKPEKISAPPSFMNWGGTGKSGPSGKEFLNKANDEAVQAIFATAKTGNVDAIKNLKAKVYDKDTGAATGEASVLEHPSQHVKGYAQQAVNEINYQLNPPKRFRFDGGHPLHSLNNAYPAHAGSPSSSAAQKLAKFIVLGEPGKVSLADVGLPDKVTHTSIGGTLTTSTYAAAAKAAFAKMPATQKQAIKSYTGHHHHAMNGSLWDGNPSGAAKSAGEALKTLGHDITPGTMLSRKIGVHGDDLNMLLSSTGKILQEPAIMSTSIRPSSWSGNVHLKLHVGPGVKGLWVGHGSDPSGGAVSNISGEDEMILPPNTRLIVLSVKPGGGGDPDGFGKSSKHIIEAVVLPTQ